MLWSYLTTAYRSLKNRPILTGINVTGLAVGLAACLLLSLWVQEQLSYDTFHPDADDIYRVVLEAQTPNGTVSGPLSPGLMAPVLRQDFPQVESVVRMDDREELIVRVGNEAFTESRVYEVDSTFFGVFSGFELQRGNETTALQAPNAVVLTASTAQRYFGSLDVLGQTVEVDGITRRVTGVTATLPDASHFHFDLLTPLELTADQQQYWSSNDLHTYVKLIEAHDRSTFGQQLQGLVAKYVGPEMQEQIGIPAGEWAEQSRFRYYPQALTSIYLHSDLKYELEPTGSLAYVWTFSLVGLFILLIACINFTNLVTARATERAGEVGVRKALGAYRGQLAAQFLGEALLTSVTAFVLAAGLATSVVPLFNRVADAHVDVAAALFSPVGLVVVLGVLLTGLLAGGYPALVLSRFSPASTLKTASRSRSSGSGGWLREGLVVIQFVISIALIAATMGVWSQFDYIQNKRLGLDKDHVIALERGQRLGSQQATFKEELRQIPGVHSVGATSSMFDQQISNFLYLPNDRPSSEGVTLATIQVDAGFTEVMNIQVEDGRTFDPVRETDSTAVVINRATAETIGWDDPVGQKLNTGGNGPTYTVIGVVENFHFRSLRQRVEPLVMLLSEAPSQVLARVKPDQRAETMNAIETTWERFSASAPLSYTYVDTRFDTLHASTQRTAQLFAFFAGLAVLIACFGLFGLATYAAQRRTKEIGIRKALGATITQIVRLLTTQFLKLMGIAFLVSTPLAYLGMKSWLNDFAYRIDLGAKLFIVAGLAAATIAFVTVGVQAIRAARTDPAKALRSE